jgi:short-subunit dehydrogenase
LNTRSALVTGASRGIGRAIAVQLAECGFGLTVSSRDPDDLKELKESLLAAGSPQVEMVAADLADVPAVARLATAHGGVFGGMNALVLNAGVGSAGPIDTYPVKRIAKTFDVNFFAAVTLLQASLPWLRRAARLDPDRGTRVIALSSITGVYPEGNLAVYGASKAALISLIDTLTVEEAANGVLGTAIAPGYVNTDMAAWVTDTVPQQSMIPPEDVARVVAMLVSLGSQTVVPRLAMTRAAGNAYTA